jgi:predicted acylesterase/phospholipase RssA
MAKTAFDHSQQASAIDPEPPTDRRRARAAEHPPRRLSPTAGDVASGARPRPPFECIAFLLQGGGALGAYQAGVYEALTEADLHPDWIAGVSIGAINAALIAGNAPEPRVEKLRAFWERVTAKHCGDWSERLLSAKGDAARQWQNQISANLALVSGAPASSRRVFQRRGFIRPAPWRLRAFTILVGSG